MNRVPVWSLCLPWMLGLATPALAAQPPSGQVPPAARALLSDCKATPVPGGSQFMCGGLVASISEFPGLAVKDSQASQIAGIRAAIKGELKTADTTFKAGDKTWPAVRLTVRKAGQVADAFEGIMLAFEGAPNTARIAFCGAAPSNRALIDRCARILPILAEVGPAPFAGPPSEPTFLGKKVVVPAGCTTVDVSDQGFRLACGETASLAALRLGGPEDMPKIVKMLGDQLLSAIPGATEEKERACRLAGSATRCRVIAMGEGSGRASILLGAALIQKTPYYVQCAQLASQRGVHPLCANYIAF